MLPRRGFAWVCLLLPCFTIACSVTAPPRPPDADTVIYVIERGWHTDIGLPVAEVAGPLVSLKEIFPGVRFLTFGFGERQFVLDRQKTFRSMLNALLPSRSVLLMTALQTTPEAAFGPSNVVVLPISHAGLARIQVTIWQELERSSADEPVRLANGPYPGSAFYAARSTYNGVFTCNTWTAETLRTGGLSMPVAGVLFSGQVMGMAHWIAARHALSASN